jgi:VanZ family protein
MAAIFFVSADPTPPLPSSSPDKPLHALAYCGLALLTCRAVARRFPARLTPRMAMMTLLITIGYAIFDELHQRRVPNRSAELADVYADAAGAAMGVIAAWACGIIRAPKSQIPDPKPQR